MSDAKKPAKKAAIETKKKAKKIVVSDESTDAIKDATPDEAKELDIQDFAESPDKEKPKEDSDSSADEVLESVQQSSEEDEKPADDEESEADQPATETPEEHKQHEIEELQHEVEDMAETEAEMIEESEKTIEDAMREAEEQEEAEDTVFAPDPEVDKAVDEIVRREGDTQIEADDSALGIAPVKTRREKIKGFFVGWWRNKIARYGTMLAILLIAASIVFIPGVRYGVLNTAGVRVDASLTVVDEKTRLPLRDIAVTLQGNEATSDEEGMVSFSNLKLGESTLLIAKRGYADVDKTITLGWGSNPLGANGITATGEQYQFALTHWLTSKPVTENAEAVAGENSATANESGMILLTIGEDNLDQVEIQIKADGYRSETFTVADLTDGETKVEMVPGRRHAFISNRNGNYDVYAIDVDGMNEELIVPATEKEREVPSLLQHQSKNVAAFVSSRSGETNDDGFKFDELFILNTETGDLERLLRSEQLRLIGWNNDRVVYSQVIEGTSAGNPERSKLFSYHHVTGEKIELASANYFNDVELVNDTLYYSVSSFAVPLSQAKLYSINVNGGESELVIDNQVWNLFRVDYDRILVSAQDQLWYEIVDGEVSEIDRQSTPSGRAYLDNPFGQNSAWVEIRDGKGTILTRGFDGEEAIVFAAPGLSSLQYWVDETTLLYRVVSASETADYILSLEAVEGEGLEPIKLSDVTANQRLFY